MLTKGTGTSDQDQHSRHAYLVECVTSATAIIAMFDLFCRTFGLDRCVLPIVYSVYISASIFLMQVQAAPEDQSALRRLEFSTQALNQVEALSPSELSRYPNNCGTCTEYFQVISSGLALLNKELATLQLRHSDPQGTARGVEATNLVPYHLPADDHSPLPVSPSQAAGPYASDPMFQSPWTDNFSADPSAMDPVFFDNMSSLSPISARLGTISQVSSFEHVRHPG